MTGTGSIRVGFVSGVRHAGSYADLLRSDPRVSLIGASDEPSVPDWIREDGIAMARAADIEWIDELGELLDPERIDLAIICSEPTRHARLAIAALNAGLDVLVDKPVGIDESEAAAVEEAARSNGRICTVVNRTHSPALRRLRRWIDAGNLGLPRHVDIEFLASGTHFATSVERPELVVDPALSGGGEVVNFAGYAADYLRYLTGLDVTEVYAETSTLYGGAHQQFGVEDTALISLALENGVTATVTVGRIPAAPGFGANTATVRVLGSHGYASSDDDKPAVTHFASSGDVTALPIGGFGSDNAVSSFLSHVLDRLPTRTEPDYTVADARASMRVIDAAYLSASSGQPVSVSP
ncbi:Gfo/Idh/MocA family protein [Rhodococcus erythropolis]|uniref:Gfo/Idh/MocA family protein n=1 Tax=Rhodococcus erythropolis TaxID=1833 RepID=UPI004042206E